MNISSQDEKCEVSDLYAVVNKNKTNNCRNQEGRTNTFALYAVVDKERDMTKYTEPVEAVTSTDLYSVVDKSRKNKKVQIKEQKIVNEANVTPFPSKEKTDNENSVVTNSCIKLPKVTKKLINIIWSLAAAAMLIIIVVFVIATIIGFVRVSHLQSNSPPNSSKCHPELNLNNSNTISKLLSNSSFSHLQDFFNDYKHLRNLVASCYSGGDLTLNLCVNSALSLYGNTLLAPAMSCRDLHELVPHAPSGNYFVTASDGSIVQVYCDMIATCGNMTGGLTRIASLNSDTRSLYCTGNISLDCMYGCFKSSPQPGCSALAFPPLNLNLSYSHVCGTLEGGYFGTPNGFAGSRRSSNTTINDNYVDGISLTYGDPSNRTHIWTFSACNIERSATQPQYVGIHYSILQEHMSAIPITFQRNFLPLLKNEIEVRFCQDENRDTTTKEGVYLVSVNLYVH